MPPLVVGTNSKRRNWLPGSNSIVTSFTPARMCAGVDVES